MKKIAARYLLPLVQRLGSSWSDDTPRYARISGNVFFAVFAAVLMVGAVGYGFNTVLRGPISGMTDVTRHTVAESTLVTSSRLAIIGATTHQASGGDCDADGFVEPLPFFDAGTNPHPTNGGWMPRGTGTPPSWTLVPNSLDPWKTEYGYCAWDSGSAIGAAGCGGSVGRLAGSPGKKSQSFVIISAGKNKKFETTCSAYNGATPDAVLYTKASGSDDIVLGYTYTEANDVGNGLWKGTNSPTNTIASTDKNLEVKGTGTFAAPIKLTAGGLVLPDSTTTGACNAANDRQLRRNMTDLANPTIEVCDFTGGMDWNSISGTANGSGGSASSGTGDNYSALTGTQIARWPFDETSGTTAFDMRGSNNGTLYGTPVWSPTEGVLKGALTFNGTTQYVRVKDKSYLRPTSMTISMWVKSAGTQVTYATLLEKTWKDGNCCTYHTFSIGQDYGTHGLFQLNFGSPGGFDYTYWGNDNYRLPDNKWVNLVAVFDMSRHMVIAYADGEAKGSAGPDPSYELQWDSTPGLDNDWYIGNSKGGSNGWNGQIDDVRIYNYALNSDEITAIYKAGISGLNTPGPVKTGPIYSLGDDTAGASGNGTTLGSTTTYVAQAVLATPDFVQISASVQHACGVKADGTIWCWGENSNDTAGNAANASTNIQTPVKVDNMTNTIKVSASEFETCALKADGTIWCWGGAYYGELGNGQNGDSLAPVQVSNITDFIDVSVTSRTACGIRANGTAWCWGQGGNGQLGNGGTDSENIPVQVSNVTDFASLSENTGGTNFYMCGITRRGIGYCWGEEDRNNFGNGATTADQLVPSQILNITDWKKISMGYQHTCGLRANGQAYCWGGDDYGMLGNGTAITTDQNVPYLIPDFSDVIDISAEKYGGCLLRSGGSLYCWGYDWGSDSPTPVGNGGPYFSVASGNNNVYMLLNTTVKKTSAALAKDRDRLAVAKSESCFIDSDKTAWCWGGNAVGQLGNGTTAASTVSPSKVTLDGAWSVIAAGGNTANTNGLTCGIKNNGGLYCWGADTTEGLGNGAGTTNVSSPVAIGVAYSQWSQVAVGANSACAINADGTLWCWGSDANSHTGGAGTKDIPTKISDVGPWQRIAMNGANTCGIKQNGELYCWGSNASGQTGTGGTATTDVTTPKIVNSAGPWIDVSVARLGACGIKQNGTLWCWGSNTVHRQFGDTFSPILISDPGPWSSVSAYETHVCGTKVDGSAWCFGTYNADGRQGNGTTANSYLPVRVRGGNDWTAIKTGTDHTCGMKSDGSVWCWGSDTNGQLGNGTALTANQTTPSRVTLVPKPPSLTWNNNGTSYSPPAGMNLVLGTARTISNNGDNSDGLRLNGSGRTSLLQSATANQFLLDTQGNNGSAQVLFKNLATGPAYDSISGLVARWKFDETAGATTAADSAGGYNGTLVNMTPASVWGAGKVNNALTFDGVDDKVTVASVPSSVFAGNMTYSFWVNSALATNGKWFVGMVVSDDTDYCEQGMGIVYDTANSQNHVASLWGQCGGGTTYARNSAANSIVSSTWQYVVIVVDYTQPTASKVRFYVNGVDVSGPSGSGSGNYTGFTPTNMTIGINPYYTVSATPGKLDDLRLYNRALTASEVSQLYNSFIVASSNPMLRTIGLDYISGNLEFARSNTGADQWAQDIALHDLEIASNGNVGVGTTGQPLAKLDVNGAIRVGNSASCSSTKAGMIEYNAGAWRYCNSAGSWATFGSWVTPTLWRAQKQGSIVANEFLGMGIRQGGDVWSWGGAGSGSLGNNTTSPDMSTSVALHSSSSSTGWTDWVYITSGCGVRANGTAWCWGYNGNGALGDNTTNTALRPVQVIADTGTTPWTDWLTLSRGGGFYTCGTRANGTAWCWGLGTSGRLGNNITTGMEVDRPIQVQSDSSTTGWTDWVSISTSLNNGEHTCGIRTNGTAWCWGLASAGQLGDNQTSTKRGRPVQVQSDSSTTGWTDWVSIATGEEHTCGVRANGTAWCWGYNALGQLGDNTNTNRSRPVQVQSDSSTTGWTDWVSIKTGGDFTCGIRANGTAWCWGYGDDGNLGNGISGNKTRPVQVLSNTGSAGWTNWSAISTGLSHACGVLADGSAWCWGNPQYGQLGDGQTTTSKLYPVKVK